MIIGMMVPYIIFHKHFTLMYVPKSITYTYIKSKTTKASKIQQI